MDTRLESLLTHSEWVNRLARRLVRDPQDADDLVQETWLSVLQVGELPIRSARALLATVLRSRLADRARSESRRTRREQEAARPEATPSTDELFERTAAQHEVVEAVLALPEPYRAVVLRRYFEGEPPRVIAAQLGVPLATVKTRLARGTARLRETLDERHGGDGRTWALALAPILRPRSLVTTGAAGWLVWFGAATVLTLLVPQALRLVRSTGSTAPAGLARAVLPDPDRGRAPTRLEPSLREPGPAPAARGIAEASPATQAFERAPLETEVHGRVRDLAGRPIGKLVVQRQTSPGRADSSAGTSIALTDDDGRFTLLTRPGIGSLVALSSRHATAYAGVARPEETAPVDLIVAEPLRARGVVLDAQGTGLEAVEILLRLPEAPPEASGALARTCAPVALSWHTAAGGSFEIEQAPFVPGGWLELEAPGFLPRRVTLEEAFGTDLRLVLTRATGQGCVVQGRVVDPRGAGVDGALVSDGTTQVTTAQDGAFVLHADRAPARLLAVAAGFLPAEVEATSTTQPAWPGHLEIRLDGEPLSLRGRVLARDGTGVGGAWVWIEDPTLLVAGDHDEDERIEGGPPLPGIEAMLPAGALIESALAGEPEQVWRRVRSDASGAFELDGLARRSYRVAALDEVTLQQVVLSDVAAGRDDLVLVLDPADARGRLSARVVGPDGLALAGVAVVAEREALRLVDEGVPIWTQLVRRPGVATDAAGHFELVNLAASGLVLRFQGESIFTRRIALEDLAPAQDIVVERACGLRVLLSEGDPAQAFEVLDRHGERLEIESRLGDRTRRRRRAALFAGRSDMVTVGETARELVLLDARGQRRTLPLRLLPGELIEVRP